MNKLFITWLLLFYINSFAQTNNDEISIFDKSGNAQAYISKDLTIYLWSGEPVAYLNNSNDLWHVYGFNGKHLGWYINGIIYDNDGNAVGAQKRCNKYVYFNGGYEGNEKYAAIEKHEKKWHQ